MRTIDLFNNCTVSDPSYRIEESTAGKLEHQNHYRQFESLFQVLHLVSCTSERPKSENRRNSNGKTEVRMERT
jgi:hypothetical protein